MKHIIADNSWRFETEPFPRFASELIFGRHKWNRVFVPVVGGLRPQPTEDGRPPVLPADTFVIRRSNKSGAYLICPGGDPTNRCLLMAGIKSGFGGMTRIHPDTTAVILRAESVRTCLRHATYVAAVLTRPINKVPTKLVLGSIERNGARLVVYHLSDKGEVVVSKYSSEKEYLSPKSSCRKDTGDMEVI